MPLNSREAIGMQISNGGDNGLLRKRRAGNVTPLSPADSAHIDRNGGLPALQQLNSNLGSILQDMRNRNASLTNGPAGGGPNLLLKARLAANGGDGGVRTVADQQPTMGLLGRRAAEAAAMEEGIPRTSPLIEARWGPQGDHTRQVLERQGITDAKAGQGAALYVNSRLNRGTSENPNPMYESALVAAKNRADAKKQRKADARELITARAQRGAMQREQRMAARAQNAVANTESLLLQAAMRGNPQAVPMLGLLTKARTEAMQMQMEQQRAAMGFGLEQQRVDMQGQQLADARKQAKKELRLGRKKLDAEEKARVEQLALMKKQQENEFTLGQARNNNDRMRAEAESTLAQAKARELEGDQYDSLSPESLTSAYNNAAQPVDVERDIPGMMEVLSQIGHLPPAEQAQKLRELNISPRMLDELIKEHEGHRPNANLLPSMPWETDHTKRMTEWGNEMAEWSAILSKLKSARGSLGETLQLESGGRRQRTSKE